MSLKPHSLKKGDRVTLNLTTPLLKAIQADLTFDSNLGYITKEEAEEALKAVNSNIVMTIDFLDHRSTKACYYLLYYKDDNGNERPFPFPMEEREITLHENTPN